MSEFEQDLIGARKTLGELFEPSIATFSEECTSIVSDLKDTLLDASSWNLGLVQSTLRFLHTLKGTSAVMGFKEFSSIVHHLEDYFVSHNKENILPSKSVIFHAAEFCDVTTVAIDLFARPEIEAQALEKAQNSMLTVLEKIVLARESTGKKAHEETESRAAVPAVMKEQGHSLSHHAFDSIFWTLLKNVEIINQMPHFKGQEEILHDLERAVFTLTRSRISHLSKLSNKVRQLVQGLSQQLDKEVNLTLIGFESEIDSNLLRALSELLTHLIRNALDHGIESRETRLRQNKPAMGELSLEIAITAERTIVTLSEDGGGIDGDFCAKRAVEKGLITQERAFTMTAYEKQELIFLPGFSTKELTTDISGRGVGMDAVMTEVTKQGGTIVIDSRMNEGTSFTMEFPAPFLYNQCLIFRYEHQYFSLNLESIIGFEKDSSTTTFDTGIARVVGSEQEFLVIGLEELDSNYGKNDRPFVMLNLDEILVGLYVDEIVGNHRMLVFASERAENMPVYLNGISSDKEVGSIFNVDTTVIKRDLNLYMIKEGNVMSDSQGGLHLFDEEVQPAPVEVKERVKASTPPTHTASAPSGQDNFKLLSEYFASESFGNELNREIAIFTNDEDQKLALLEEAANIIDSILDATEDAVDSETFEILLAIEYCSLKNRWLKYNTQLDIFEKESPDLLKMILGKVTVASTLLKILESLLSSQSINRIARVLEQPIAA